jgi:hypothetical protein
MATAAAVKVNATGGPQNVQSRLSGPMEGTVAPGAETTMELDLDVDFASRRPSFAMVPTPITPGADTGYAGGSSGS